MCSPSIAFAAVSVVGSLAASAEANANADIQQQHLEAQTKLNIEELTRERAAIGYAGTDDALLLQNFNRRTTAAVIAAASEIGLNPTATTEALIRDAGSAAAFRNAALYRNIDNAFDANAYAFDQVGLNLNAQTQNIDAGRQSFMSAALRSVVAGGQGYAAGSSISSSLDKTVASAAEFSYIGDASPIGGPNA